MAAKAGAIVPLPKTGTSSLLMLVIGLLVVTAVAGGAGWVIGQQFFQLSRFEIIKDIQVEEARHDAAHGAKPALTNIRELPPIVTNLASPEDVWIRVEATVVIDDPAVPNTDIMLKEIAGDFLAFLRTLSISQVQGAIGLQHLRQDLMERAAIRSNNRVKEVIISSMVIQ